MASVERGRESERKGEAMSHIRAIAAAALAASPLIWAGCSGSSGELPRTARVLRPDEVRITLGKAPPAAEPVSEEAPAATEPAAEPAGEEGSDQPK